MASKSPTALKQGINNQPNETQIAALKQLGLNIYDKVKEKFPRSFSNSFFRSQALNKVIGGASASQHTKGEAADIDAPSERENLDIFNFVRGTLDFDQLIAEFPTEEGPSWCHISYKNKEKNRHQVLVGTKNKDNKTVYSIYTGQETWASVKLKKAPSKSAK